MIGGYIYHKADKRFHAQLKKLLNESYHNFQCAENGFLFYDNGFSKPKTTLCSAEDLTILTQDLLITRDSDGNYRYLNPNDEFLTLFKKEKEGSLKKIVNNFRLIITKQFEDHVTLFLVSNRAGNGRIFYYKTNSGILFSSDIRFLFKIVPFTVNDLAMYAILKYGAIPEPLTICEGIEAIPPGNFLRYNSRKNTCDIKPYFQFEFPCERELFSESKLDSYIQPVKLMLRNSAKFLSKQQSTILISGGIDSSLYALYLKEFCSNPIKGVHCTFGEHDPEFPFAQELAQMINATFHVGKMKEEKALNILNDTISLTGHPFSDFSSMPIVYILKFMKDNLENEEILIEGNGGDDCFGFPDLGSQQKFKFKNLLPSPLKEATSFLFKNSKSWKWESDNKLFSKITAISDVHELSLINYFLVLTPVNFLGLNTYKSWDSELNTLMEEVFTNYEKSGDSLSYKAKITIRQLMHVNSRRWAAKAFSVGENLGIRVLYPYIWLDVLIEQGKIPWEAKINKGIVKWPLKRLLEEHMSNDFIYRKKSGFIPPLVRWLTSTQFNHMVQDTLLSTNGNMSRIVPKKIFNELLNDALKGKNLRHSILNFLWGAFFTEKWIENYRNV